MIGPICSYLLFHMIFPKNLKSSFSWARYYFWHFDFSVLSLNRLDDNHLLMPKKVNFWQNLLSENVNKWVVFFIVAFIVLSFLLFCQLVSITCGLLSSLMCQVLIDWTDLFLPVVSHDFSEKFEKFFQMSSLLFLTFWFFCSVT